MAQSGENGYLCDGKLVECLDTIEQIRDVKFNYKSSLVNRKQIVLTDRTQSLVSILYQLKKQCFVDSKIYGDNIINLYPLVKKYISGTLLDATSSERIVGATVSIVNQSITVTDPDGMFRLYTIDDSIVINIYHPDYQLARLKLSAIKKRKEES